MASGLRNVDRRREQRDAEALGPGARAEHCHLEIRGSLDLCHQHGKRALGLDAGANVAQPRFGHLRYVRTDLTEGLLYLTVVFRCV
eukprot:scaffold529_cov308-Pinguiococcus_pyrenoidosus.AAC.17